MLTAKLILERLDRDGKLLERKEQRSRSFTKGFLQLLYVAHAQIAYGAPYSMQDITNTARDVDSSGQYSEGYYKGILKTGSTPGGCEQLIHAGHSENAAANTIINISVVGEDIGIVVGTGVTAVTPTDYALATRILHGRTAGRLEYGGCEFIGIAFVNPNGEFTIRRYFTNASGGSITVNEVGLYAAGTKMVANDYGFTWPFAIARDIVSPGVAVADGEILRVTYVPQITV